MRVATDISLLHAACAADDVAVVLHRLPAHDIGLLADLDGIDEAWDDWLAVERARQSEAIVRERSEEHTSELQSLMRISYPVFCMKKKRLHETHPQQALPHTHPHPKRAARTSAALSNAHA